MNNAIDELFHWYDSFNDDLKNILDVNASLATGIDYNTIAGIELTDGEKMMNDIGLYIKRG